MTRLSLLVLAAVTLAGPALAQDEAALIERGRYLATAADCAACHRTAEPDGAPFAGGYAIASPMGRTVASNITPSTRFGIGGWSEEQFARACARAWPRTATCIRRCPTPPMQRCPMPMCTRSGPT